MPAEIESEEWNGLWQGSVATRPSRAEGGLWRERWAEGGLVRSHKARDRTIDPDTVVVRVAFFEGHGG